MGICLRLSPRHLRQTGILSFVCFVVEEIGIWSFLLQWAKCRQLSNGQTGRHCMIGSYSKDMAQGESVGSFDRSK